MKQTPVSGYRLPPLILHPFSSAEEHSVLLESSRASLALQGITPRGDATLEELERQLIRGRYSELQMVYYIGKDVCRWAEQCAEAVQADRVFGHDRIRMETFAVLLVDFIPPHVRTKLESWGVLDYTALFRRAFGFHSVLTELPSSHLLTKDFLRYYHRYLDHWYEQKLRNVVFDRPVRDQFTFELFASGEYTSMLEQSWADDKRR